MTSRGDQLLNENLVFRGHNTPKSGPFKTKKDAQTLSKQLPNNFEKVQKTTFSTPKIAKNDPLKCQICINSGSKRGKYPKTHRLKKIDFFIYFRF